ncbi:hypothetical protein [Lysobacter gummosus]
MVVGKSESLRANPLAPFFKGGTRSGWGAAAKGSPAPRFLLLLFPL